MRLTNPLLFAVLCSSSTMMMVAGFSTFGIVHPHHSAAKQTSVGRSVVLGQQHWKRTVFRRGDRYQRKSLALASGEESILLETAVSASTSPLLAFTNALATSPEVWSAVIMFSIVALLFAWEESIKSVRKALCAPLLPVVDSMLAEMGGLGFIGLFLSVFVTSGLLGDVIEHLSEKYFHDGEILLETFEFLHTAFFEVGVAFFVVAGLTVAKVLQKIRSLTEVTTAALDTSGDGIVSLDELADALHVPTTEVDLDGDGDLTKEELSQALLRSEQLCRTNYWKEATLSEVDVKVEALVFREQFMTKLKLPSVFCMERYCERVFGHNLEEMVELSPLTWLPLVPPISLIRTVDMSRDIVSAASANAALSCGYFLGTPQALVANCLLAVVGFTWGFWNFYKMASIKQMLKPTIVRDSKGNGNAIMLPPRYEVDELFEKYNSSPGIFGTIESFFHKPARNRHEELFGAAGAAGPDLYRSSIKFQTWLMVSQIIFWGGEVVGRDILAIIRNSQVGNPDLLYPELALYGTFVAISIVQLWLVPRTFLNYSLITSIESLYKKKILLDVCGDEYCVPTIDEPILAAVNKESPVQPTPAAVNKESPINPTPVAETI